jgi:hypothetical protein
MRSATMGVARRSMGVGALLVLALTFAGPRAVAAPPANDTRATATPIGPPPATLSGTTADATSEPSDPPMCHTGGDLPDTVWYSLRADHTGALVITLDAGGPRDAIVAVYRVQRSHLNQAGCAVDDGSGQANIPFFARADERLYVVVAPQATSQRGPFTLRLRAVDPLATPPGDVLPTAGAWGVLEPLLHLDAAWHARLTEGTTYQVAAWSFAGSANECPRVELYSPPVRRFGSPAKVISCRGYSMFTPRPGQSGDWVVRISTTEHVAPAFRYHVQLAAASPDDTAPGIPLANGATVRGSLAATGIDRVDLYRFSVRSPSTLSAEAKLPVSAQADLVLMREDGAVMRCACESSGTQSLSSQIRPGHYFIAVRARGANTFAYTLHRLARASTTTHVVVSGSPAYPGAAVSVQSTTSPAPRGGWVTMTVERFDPLGGWQYLRQARLPASGGHATLTFTTSAEGRYRVSTSYAGDLSSSPSRGNPVTFAVEAPLES